MPVTVAQLSDQLIKSGLLPEEQIRAAAQSVGGLSEEASSESLARQLVRDGRLTLFQAQQAVNGKAAALILGSYVILEKLGQGGMGQVFRARHRTMKREVALKVISSAVVKDETSLKRFQREVEAAAQLNHPNIVTAYDAGEHKGTHFLVMELVRGSDLSSAVKKAGPMKSSRAVQCVMQAARGLAYAHSNGIVHRDIKPANLLLDESGTIKILDMGLARFEDGGQDHASVAGLTGTGMLMGTIDYMSPEQAMDSKTADARSDIYSLGCTLFFLMTGKAVYEEDTVMKRVMAHQAAPIPQLPMLDSQLQSIFARSIAKRPEQRFQSMDQLVQELQSWLARSSDAAVGPTAEMPLTGGSGLVIPDDVILKDEGPKSSVQTLQPPAESSPDTTPSMSAAAQTLGSQPKKPMTANESFGRKTGPQAAAEAATRAGSVTTAGAKKVSTGTSARPTASSGGSSRSGLAPAGVAGDDEIPISEATAGSLPPRRRSTQRLTLENRRPPKQPAGKKILAACGGGAFLLAIISIIVITIRDKDGKETVIKVPEGTEVTVKPADGGAVEIAQIPDSVSREATAHSAANGNTPDPVSTTWHGWPADAPKPAIAPFDAAQAKAHQEEWAAYLKVPVEYTNTIGMKFRLIPPGEFLMGSTPEEIEAAIAADSESSLDFWRERIQSEAPQRKTIVNHPVYLCITEVTQAQYEEVIGSNPSFFASSGPVKETAERVAGMVTASHPVDGVSWEDAVIFCAALSQQELLEPLYSRADGKIQSKLDGDGYRLPLEKEWEFSCRAGTTTRFWFGDDDSGINDAGWNKGKNHTFPVSRLNPNPFGLYDTCGNVFELVQDSWESSPESLTAGSTSLQPGTTKVIRGGAYGLGSWGHRSTSRSYQDQTYRIRHTGMRPVLTVDAVRQALKVTGPSIPNPASTTPAASTTWHGWPADAPKPAIAPFDAEQAKRHQEEWAAYLKVPMEYTNSIGMKFRLIPPGEFLMGSTPEEIAAAVQRVGGDKLWMENVQSESPQHKVILTQPIYLGVNEVTQAEYEKVMGVNPSHFAPLGMGKEAVVGLETAEHPVETVSWNDAAEFCAKLSQQEKLKPAYFRADWTITPLDGTGYRLPSEAEWEFACRAGTVTKYWIGDKDEDLLKTGWFGVNSGGRTHAAGELKANHPFGLHDIHGNVWEFVQDGWEATYYGQFAENPAINPNSPFLASSQRMVRGGGWHGLPSHCRSSSRRSYGPNAPFNINGFRALLTVDAVRQLLKQQAKVSATDATDLAADAPSVDPAAQPIPNAPQPTSPNSSMVVAAPILIPPVDPLSEIPAGVVTALPFDPGPAAKWKVGDPISPRALVGSPEPIRNLASWSVETVSHLVWPGSIRVSPDGQRVATCGTVDATVRIWKLPTDRQQSPSLERILLGESGSVADAVWSHSGRLIATTNQNQKVISVYDAVSGRRLMSVPNEHGGASTLHWSPDDTKILLPSWYLCVLDLATRELKKSEPAENFHRGAWSPDGREIATLCEGDGGKVTFWDSETLKLLSESSDPSLFQTSGFGWSPDGKWLAVGGRNGRVSLWDTTTRRKAKDVVTNESVDWAHFSWERTPPTGEAKHPRWPRLMLTSSYLSEIWDAELTTKLTSCNSVSNQVCGDWLPDGKRVVTVGTAFPLPQVFDAETGEKASVATSQPPNYQGTFSVSPDGKTLRALYDEELLIFNAETGEYLKKFSKVAGRLLSTSPKDDWIVVYYKDADDQPVVMVDTATYEKRIPLAGHRGKVTAVNWSADNQFLATCDSAGVLRIWKAADQSLVQEIKSARPLLSVIWSPDGKQLATAADDRIIRLWNTQTWTQTREFPPVDLLVATGPNVISWCPTADQIAVATNAANVQVLDIKTGVFSEPVINLSVGLTGVTWSPDGRQLLAGNGGHGGSEIGLRIVRAKSFTSAHGHGDPIQWLPDSQRLITGQAVAAAIQAIDARRKTRLGALLPRMPDGGWLCIGADGHYRGSEGIEKQIVYVALHKDGSQTTHTPADFEARFGWKNDPSKASFLKLDNDSQ